MEPEALDDIVREFLVESHENLDQLDRDLVALEDSPDDRERLCSVFRTIHTIKGTSGFLAFPKLEHVTHVGESLLVLLRDGKLRLNGVITDVLLAMVDAVRQILSHIETEQREGDEDYTELVTTLEQLQVTGGLGIPDTPPTSKTAHRALELVENAAAQIETIAKPDSATAPASQSVSATAPGHPPSKKPPASPAAKPANVAPTTPTKALQPEAIEVEKSSSLSVNDATVRIDVNLLDKLMNLVGELVLARNQILQHGGATEDAALAAACQRLNLITTELQEGVMKTRMQPIRNVWSKLPRVVRDLSQSCGKQVRMRMDGADTELDKTILEAIKDPLTHIVRNAVDHGIEPPDVRIAAGKPAEGTLWLRAFHEGGQVNIEISDDGGGIHLERVRQKAISQGLITAEQAAALSERELTNLILLPGFSTAATVTNVSGRGVGMDVVKTNVERIGGSLEIHSEFGQGTTLRIKIPLTLAIVPALTVLCRGQRFCIPQVSLQELVRLDGARVRQEIELIHSVPVYRLRGQLLPLLYLDEELKLHPRRTHDERCAAETANIVVLRAEDRVFGLVVDSVTDTQEIVVKPLGQLLKDLRVYAGATIMGDGTISLILDVIGLARQGRVLTEHREAPLSDASEANAANAGRQSWLIVDPGDGSRAAIGLGTVARLEEFQIDAVERVGRDEVVQYRGRILPLFRLVTDYSQSACGQWAQADPEAPARQRVPVVVYQQNGRQVGIVVGHILDIVEHSLSADTDGPPSASGLESAIINGRVTRVIDLGALVQAAV